MPEVISLEPSDLFQLLDARRRALGLSQHELCTRAFGEGATNTTWQSLRRGASIHQSKLLALLHTLGLRLSLDPVEVFSSDVVASEVNQEVEPGGAEVPLDQLSEALSVIGKEHPNAILEGVDLQNVEAITANLEFTRRLNLMAHVKGRGGRTLALKEQELDKQAEVRTSEQFVEIGWLNDTTDDAPVRIARSWFLRERLAHVSCRFAKSPADEAMMPTVRPNSLVMIDTTAPIASQRIAAFDPARLAGHGINDADKGEIHIARVTRAEKLWVLTRDAVGHRAEVVDHELMKEAYLGQIVWVGSRI